MTTCLVTDDSSPASLAFASRAKTGRDIAERRTRRRSRKKDSHIDIYTGPCLQWELIFAAIRAGEGSTKSN